MHVRDLHISLPSKDSKLSSKYLASAIRGQNIWQYCEFTLIKMKSFFLHLVNRHDVPVLSHVLL